jgi:hypothetical protein
MNFHKGHVLLYSNYSKADHFIERYIQAGLPENLPEKFKRSEVLRLKKQNKSIFCVQREEKGDKVRYEITH